MIVNSKLYTVLSTTDLEKAKKFYGETLGLKEAPLREAEMADLRSKGVQFEEYDFPGLKTENGVATLGKLKASWFKDPDGNIISLTKVG